ncbi:MAG: hypothetical protein BGP20_07035 [Thiobacillus sp. 63-78]|nr:MAG: hypothetical protein ABT21_14365 [Thiobacillus sp. SCN 65-179]OJZ15661.1 MAG: hypothetical protein BGP20_07035 [Thiobacillus sp. 63-78]
MLARRRLSRSKSHFGGFFPEGGKLFFVNPISVNLVFFPFVEVGTGIEFGESTIFLSRRIRIVFSYPFLISISVAVSHFGFVGAIAIGQI